MLKFLKEQDSITNLERTRNLAIIGGAISGITVIWTVLFSQFSGAFSGWQSGDVVAALIATACTALVVYVVDYGTKVDLPYAMDLLVSGRAFKDFRKNWRVFLFAFILLSFCFARLAFTAAIDWYGRGEMVNAVMPKPETRNVVALKDSLSKATRLAVAPVEKDIKDIKRQISTVERQVEKENPEMILRIKNKQDKWGWNATELRKRKERATKELRAQLSKKEELHTAILARETKTADEIISFEQSKNQGAINSYHETKNIVANGAGYFGVGCAATVLIVSFLLSLVNFADQDRPEYYKKHEIKKTAVAPVEKGSDSAPAPSLPHLQPIKHGGDERLVENLLHRVSSLSAELSEVKNRQPQVVEKIVEKTVEKQPESFDKSPKLLSDNKDSKSTVENSVEIVSVDTKNLRDATMKQWERSFTSKEEATRKTNRQKAEQGIRQLEQLGFSVQVNGTKLSITSKS